MTKKQRAIVTVLVVLLLTSISGNIYLYNNLLDESQKSAESVAKLQDEINEYKNTIDELDGAIEKLNKKISSLLEANTQAAMEIDELKNMSKKEQSVEGTIEEVKPPVNKPPVNKPPQGGAPYVDIPGGGLATDVPRGTNSTGTEAPGGGSGGYS